MTGSRDWDVIVVGAGPAGSIAALSALRERPGARVLLLDRSDFPRDKSCGDGIAPHVLDVLEQVGAADVAGALLRDHPPVRTLALSVGALAVARDMRRPALVVPRAEFDDRLVEAAVAAGAVLRRHRVRLAVERGPSVVLDGELSARVVVAADGAGSPVGRSLGRSFRGRSALGIRAYAATTPGAVGRQVIRFGEDRQPSYAWSFDLGNGWSNVGYGEVLTERRPPPTRELMVRRLEGLLPGSTTRARSWLGHHLPLSSARWAQPRGRVLFAGDAAGLVNPLTGEGIYYAVLTGALAGVAAAHAAASRSVVDPAAQYRRSVRRLLRTHLVSTATAGALASSPVALRAGLRAAASSQAFFDDLVELGLGRGRITPRVVAGLVASGAGGHHGAFARGA